MLSRGVNKGGLGTIFFRFFSRMIFLFLGTCLSRISARLARFKIFIVLCPRAFVCLNEHNKHNLFSFISFLTPTFLSHKSRQLNHRILRPTIKFLRNSPNQPNNRTKNYQKNLFFIRFEQVIANSKYRS